MIQLCQLFLKMQVEFVFPYGYGRTGKTFIWKKISAAIRSKGEIVLIIASSGIVTLLIPRENCSL